MVLNFKVTETGDRIVSSENEVICRECLGMINFGEIVHFCEINKNICCDAKQCKYAMCRGIAGTMEHTDFFGILKRK